MDTDEPKTLNDVDIEELSADEIFQLIDRMPWRTKRLYLYKAIKAGKTNKQLMDLVAERILDQTIDDDPLGLYYPGTAYYWDLLEIQTAFDLKDPKSGLQKLARQLEQRDYDHELVLEVAKILQVLADTKIKKDLLRKGDIGLAVQVGEEYERLIGNGQTAGEALQSIESWFPRGKKTIERLITFYRKAMDEYNAIAQEEMANYDAGILNFELP